MCADDYQRITNVISQPHRLIEDLCVPRDLCLPHGTCSQLCEVMHDGKTKRPKPVCKCERGFVKVPLVRELNGDGDRRTCKTAGEEKPYLLSVTENEVLAFNTFHKSGVYDKIYTTKGEVAYSHHLDI